MTDNFDKINLHSNYYKEDSDGITSKIQKFSDVIKKQKDYINNARKNDEIINNLKYDQMQEKNLRLNLLNASTKNQNKQRIFNNKMV